MHHIIIQTTKRVGEFTINQETKHYGLKQCFYFFCPS
jgi:hypothetical protein